MGDVLHKLSGMTNAVALPRSQDLAGALLRQMMDAGINPDPETWALISKRHLEKLLGPTAWTAYKSMDEETSRNLFELAKTVASENPPS